MDLFEKSTHRVPPAIVVTLECRHSGNAATAVERHFDEASVHVYAHEVDVIMRGDVVDEAIMRIWLDLELEVIFAAVVRND